ncbi:hypothetical protein HDU76_007703 [Blyttiomyces sp. JEL0837]|nr:hypothetical protein HDU76_007703 [Blyttiomyces sp. JEL0837]
MHSQTSPFYRQSFVTTGKAVNILGVHPTTLKRWHKEGQIQGIALEMGKYLYDVQNFIKDNNTYLHGPETPKKNICYCRVSLRQQLNDLETQIQYLKSLYPDHEIVKDIGSGLNFKRHGLQKVVDYALQGSLGELVLAHKDRLCRFGFELIEYLLDRSGAKLVVLDNTALSPEAKLSKDLLNIIHVFSCRMYGPRKYKAEFKSKVVEGGRNSKSSQKRNVAENLQNDGNGVLSTD